MPLSLFLLGALIGGAIGGFICFQIGRNERDELETDNEILKYDNKRLRSLIKDANEVINMQKRYINQIEPRYLRREEGSQCDPFTKF